MNIMSTDKELEINLRHLGSLFAITVQNSSTKDLLDLCELRLSGNKEWDDNMGRSGVFDLVNEPF